MTRQKIESVGQSKLAPDTTTAYRSIMSSVDKFKSAVSQIRNILRGPGVGITGMDSMRHICLYLLSRFITRDKVAGLGVPEEFAWETLMDTAQTKNGGVQKVLDSFFNTEADCLVRHFDRLFGTDKFPFDIKNPQKHKEIMEILNKVNLVEVDSKQDILGLVFEDHLRTGSSAPRDLGQFFTDRSVCEYMVEKANPGFKAKGVPESICDPSMGTAGLLTAYVKYYKKHHQNQPINWSVQQKEIHGCDTDARVAGVARLNLFMEMGGVTPTNLLTQDSLYNDLTLSGYDIILANEPFALAGIDYKDVCERVRALKINGKASEPLFLQLMMVSLNRGGRCVVIVPDGTLEITQKLHSRTRKYLLDNFELKEVIKMNGQFFMNTGIKPSILYFENTGQPTKEVTFKEIVQNSKGEIVETTLVTVPREKFDDTCVLKARKYMEDEPVLSTQGFPQVTLEEVCESKNGKTLSAAEKLEHGEYDVMGGGMNYIGKTDKYNRQGDTISISKSGASAGFIAFHQKKYWAGDCLTIVSKDEDRMSTKFIYHYLKLNSHLTMSKTTGSTIPHCKWDDIKGITLPAPPRPVQDEIVAALERVLSPGTGTLSNTLTQIDRTMDKAAAAAAATTPLQRQVRDAASQAKDIRSQIITDLKEQMTTIMKSVVRRQFPKMVLSDVLEDVPCGKTVATSSAVPGPYPLYSSSLEAIGTHNEAAYNEGEWIIQGSRGTITDAIHYETRKFSVSNNVFVAKRKASNDKVSMKFAYYQLRLNRNTEALISDSVIPALTKKSFYAIEIVAPPSEIQESVLARLEQLQSQIRALESIQRQAEDNARFILESYL